MTSKLDLEAIAGEMKSAQDRRAHLEPFTERLAGFDTAAAYDVARRIHEARLREGSAPVGRKIGFTNSDLWAVYGVREPIWAYVYDTTVSRLSNVRGVCHLGGFVEPRIEPEIVVHFDSAPPRTDDPAELLASVDWIAHGIEVVQSHFRDWRFRAADTIADSSLHGALLVGEPQPVERLGPHLESTLEEFTISLSCGGDVRDTGRGANVLGTPLAAVAHLISVLANQPGAQPLQAGELVTTGTLTAALPIRAGETWRTTFNDIALPGIEVTFED